MTQPQPPIPIQAQPPATGGEAAGKETWNVRATAFFLRIFELLAVGVEVTTVLGVFYATFYVGSRLLVSDLTDPDHQRMVSVLETLNNNWRALLLLAVVLFHRSIKKFLDEVQEVLGVKRKAQPPQAVATTGQNPPPRSTGQ